MVQRRRVLVDMGDVNSQILCTAELAQMGFMPIKLREILDARPPGTERLVEGTYSFGFFSIIMTHFYLRGFTEVVVNRFLPKSSDHRVNFFLLLKTFRKSSGASLIRRRNVKQIKLK